ncbi:hypothetical protein [[Clostridium] polysaccharolyticum]|uniref:Uncharacterized protein n=1 Tax=[Clostridium] polysaccharolyticum TaxID=29364 RepID=A0A1I0D7P5_9FIRM|nr:hypothetical protein [[Clostridium] polysaccharolyticum]SET27911.1 hypothetical protein SAMN04487772_11326 [[Clostridium] polysaccharolyticum]
MDIKSSLSRKTGNYRTLNKKAIAMKKSWDDVEKLLSKKGSKKQKKSSS